MSTTEEEESAPDSSSSGGRITMVAGPAVRVGPPTRLLEDKIALLCRYRLIERPPRPAGTWILLVLVCMLGGFALRHRNCCKPEFFFSIRGEILRHPQKIVSANQCCGSVTIFFGSGSGSGSHFPPSFGSGSKKIVPDPDPTSNKFRIRP
jgi:hypothetical protein